MWLWPSAGHGCGRFPEKGSSSQHLGLHLGMDSCCNSPACWSPPTPTVLLLLAISVCLLTCLTVSLDCKVIENRDYVTFSYLALVSVTGPQWELNARRLSQTLDES